MDGLDRLELTLPLPPNVANARGHWAKRRRALHGWICDAHLALHNQGLRHPSDPWPQVTVRCHFFLHNRMDTDNLAARQKPILDFLKSDRTRIGDATFRSNGFFVDDDPGHLTLLEPTQEIDRKRQRVEVTIERSI